MDIGSIRWRVDVDTAGLPSSAADVEKTTKQVNESLLSSEQIAKKAAQAVAGYFSFQAIKTGVAGVIRANTEFAASISNLSAITGATGKDLQFLAQQSKEIGRTTTLSASQAASAFKLIASAKPDLLSNAQALSEVTKQAVLLSEAAGIGLADAASTVGTSLNQFGASADEAARFVNVLAAGAKFGSSEITETAMALKNAGAAANAAGISFESTNAAIQALAAGGIKAAEAGTSLRNIILILEQEQDKNLRPSVVGLSEAIGNLAAKQMNLTELTDLFGREAVVAAQTIIDQSDSLSVLESSVTGTSTAIEQATANVDNLRGDFMMAKSATEALQIAIGERLDPSLRASTQAIAEFAGGAAQFVESDQFAAWLAKAQAGAEILALALVGRMVPAMVATTASVYAQIAAIATATTTTNVWGQRIVVATGAQNLMTATSLKLNSALAFFGGPAGVAIMAVGALAIFASRMETAAEMTARLRAEMDSLNKEELSRGIEIQKSIVRGIETQIERMSKQNQSVAAVRERMAELRMQLEEATKDLQRMENGMREIEERDFQSLVDDMTEGLVQYSGATQKASESTESFDKSVSSASKSVSSLILMMDNTEAAYVSLMGSMGAVTEQTDVITTRTTRLTEAQREANLTNQDAQDSIDGIVEKMGVQKTASEEMTQVMSLMRDDISSAFADMMMNGENAFDAIAKSFERMIYKMVADWAAAGVMNMVSKAFGGAGGYTSTLGGILSGGATKAATSAAGSAVGGGAMAGIGGAIKGAGSAVSGALAAVPGWGWALAGGAALAGILSKDSTPSSNAGFLLKDVPGASADRKFQVAPFESGFQPVGFARREDAAASAEVIDTFRAYDAAMTEMARAAGINVNMDWTKLGGIGSSETGQGSGVFVGIAAEDGRVKSASLDAQVDQYVRAWVDGLGNQINQGAKSAILAAGNADAMLAKAAELVGGLDGSHAGGLDFVPFDGYRAELHRGERVQTAAEASNSDAMAAMMDTAMMSLVKLTQRIERIVDDWDVRGLPPVRA